MENGSGVRHEIAFKVLLNGGKVAIFGSRGIEKLEVPKPVFRKAGYGLSKVALRAGPGYLDSFWFE